MRPTLDHDPLRLGFPATGLGVTLSTLALAAANEARYMRLLSGGYPISSLVFNVGTSSGNISLSIYRGRNAGRLAVPGERLWTSGAIACPAAGQATIALGATITPRLGDWFALSADNVTATFTMTVGAAVAMAAGLAYNQANAHPLPLVPSGLVAGNSRTPWIIGA